MSINDNSNKSSDNRQSQFSLSPKGSLLWQGLPFFAVVGLAAVRDSGVINMFDRAGAIVLLRRFGHDEAHQYFRRNPGNYGLVLEAMGEWVAAGEPMPPTDLLGKTNDNDYDWRADGNVYPFDTIVVWPGNAPRGTTALDAILTKLTNEFYIALSRCEYCGREGEVFDCDDCQESKVAFAVAFTDLLNLIEPDSTRRFFLSMLAVRPGPDVLTPAAAQPTTPAVAATPDGYVVKHFDCCQGNDETCPGCDNGYGRDVLYKIDPEQPAQQPFAVTLTGTTQPEAARAGAKRVRSKKVRVGDLKPGDKILSPGSRSDWLLVQQVDTQGSTTEVTTQYRIRPWLFATDHTIKTQVAK